MSQPPYRRPPAEPLPPPAGAHRPPAGYSRPPAPLPQAPHIPVPPPARPKRRAFLRFFAGACVASAWLTLGLSILGAAGTVTGGMGVARLAEGLAGARGGRYFPAPSGSGGLSDPRLGNLPGSGLPDVTSGLPDMPSGLPDVGGGAGSGGAAGQLAPLLTGPLTTAIYLAAAVTLLSGIAGFLFLLGLGYVCRNLIDVEDRALRLEQTQQLLASRLGLR